MKNALNTLLLLMCFAAFPAYSADGEGKTGAQLPRVPLLDVLGAVSKNAELTFLVDEKASAEVVVGQARLRDLSYSSLLLILRNNSLAAVKGAELINIVPVATVRQYALPVIREADDSIADQEWVTWIVSVEHMDATNFVPILRPLLPKPGHLAASSASHALIVVDRYANARRIAQIIADLDAETTAEFRSD